MQTVRIKGYPFQFSTPFQAGSVLTKGEAQALNQLRIENLTNNLREEVNKALGVLAEGQLLSAETLAELQAKFTKYDQRYAFVEKHTPRPRRGLLEAETLLVAAERVDAEARAAGRELAPDQREALIEEFARLPAVQEEARDRAGAKQQALKDSLQDLLG